MARHASTNLNAGDPADPKAYFRGWVDAPLSDHGQQVTDQTAQFFKDKQVGHIVTSDMLRAKQTAAKIHEQTGAPVTEDPRLRPWNIGALSGQEITPDRLKLSHDLQTKRPNDAAPGGESYNAFLHRYAGGLNDLLHRSSTDTVVAVIHHRNAMALDSLLYGKKTRVSGPPEPGEVIKVTPNGTKPAYMPPKQVGKKESAPNATS